MERRCDLRAALEQVGARFAMSAYNRCDVSIREPYLP